MNGFTKEEIDGMVKDACFVERLGDKMPVTVRDLCCHVKALASEVERLTADNIGLSVAGDGLNSYCETVAKTLKGWIGDSRACFAVAKDCEGTDDCPCLYCRTQKAIGWRDDD